MISAPSFFSNSFFLVTTYNPSLVRRACFQIYWRLVEDKAWDSTWGITLTSRQAVDTQLAWLGGGELPRGFLFFFSFRMGGRHQLVDPDLHWGKPKWCSAYQKACSKKQTKLIITYFMGLAPLSSSPKLNHM